MIVVKWKRSSCRCFTTRELFCETTKETTFSHTWGYSLLIWWWVMYFYVTQMLVWINLTDHVTKKNSFFSFPILLLVRFAPPTVWVSVRALLVWVTRSVCESSWFLPDLQGLQCPRPAVTRSYVISLKYNLHLSWSRLHFLTLLGFQVPRILMRGARK